MLSAGGGNATCYSRHWFHLFLLYVLAREYSVRGLVCVCSALGIAEGEAALALAPAVRTTTVRTVLATCSSILLYLFEFYILDVLSTSDYLCTLANVILSLYHFSRKLPLVVHFDTSTFIFFFIIVHLQLLQSVKSFCYILLI